MPISQARENLRVDLLLKAAEQHFGVYVEQLAAPADKAELRRQPRRRKRVQIHLHLVALVIGNEAKLVYGRHWTSPVE